ncbi:polysaccharide export protein EpsE [Chryseotalea sanaruensis]|uniref:Polysaccharide export protein EpsE n=1 Tax=Chryseotalea sanaruensis TaxID=2482724 RepID=A0A401UAS5_9BACT|nr:polysaccharide biosynthesis/export family protein [Chryseotalea sanaruensis]GCC51987.1 polysaccharide export protein EpsE [Chryseotalea sanaruensis]
MFKTSESSAIKQAANNLNQAYVLTNFDEISLKVFTKNGERIIDPDDLLMRQGMANPQQAQDLIKTQNFEIDKFGVAKLPMLNEVKLAGLTLRETELLLQKEFTKYYENAFVTVECASHRVVVLGSTGGQVVPLTFTNTSVLEILALSKAFAIDSKAQNIRLVRGNDVYILDFSTIESYRNSNMTVLPGDIVYVEPVRRPLAEGLRDYGQLLAITTSIVAILIVTLR